MASLMNDTVYVLQQILNLLGNVQVNCEMVDVVLGVVVVI